MPQAGAARTWICLNRLEHGIGQLTCKASFVAHRRIAAWSKLVGQHYRYTLLSYTAKVVPGRDTVNDIIERTVAAGLGQRWNRLSNSELYKEKRLKRESRICPSNRPRNNQPIA